VWPWKFRNDDALENVLSVKVKPQHCDNKVATGVHDLSKLLHFMRHQFFNLRTNLIDIQIDL